MSSLFRKILLAVTLMIILISCSSFPQQLNTLEKNNLSERQKTISRVFEKIEIGISSGNVDLLSDYLSSQTYLSLSNGIGGYYSSNQAYYVLEDFFRDYKATGFRFGSIQSNNGSPFATGIYKYHFRGMKGSAQVFISLKRSARKWKITQISIN